MKTTNYAWRIAVPAVAGCFLLAAAAPAQLQFDELLKSHLPPGYTSASVLGDTDGDGDLDALGNGLFQNDGRGVFTDVTATHLPPEYTGAFVLGDVDGDGDLDALGTGIYLNDGAGTFTDATASHLPTGYGTYASSAALGDVDGDGDLDVLLGRDGYLGSRECQDPWSGIGGYIVSYYYTQPNELYLNDGTGIFTEAPAGHLPSDSQQTNAVALDDVDGDGDLDAVIGNQSWSGVGPYCEWFTEAGPNKLYLNDGTGIFTDVTATRMPIDNDNTLAVALGDVDRDGDTDLFFGNSGQNHLYLNDGSGTFADVTSSHLAPSCTGASVLGDVDGDGDFDALGVGLYLNNGVGVFTDVSATHLPPSYAGPSLLGDVDGDGDLDALGAGLYLNNGNGVFSETTVARMPADSDKTSAVAVADVDLDGDPDVVFGGEGQNRLYLNDGTGTFVDQTATRMPPDSDPTYAVAVADVDLDGDPDLVLGNGALLGRQNRLYLNDGAGTFADVTAARMPGDSDDTRAVAVADIDLDGDPDLVLGSWALGIGLGSRQNRLYINDGAGTFADATATRMPIDSDPTFAVAFADVDLDGDPDLMCANGGQNRLYLNDGTGTFVDETATRMPLDSDTTYAVAFADMDLDGDADLVFGNPFSQNRLYLNDGSGTFTDATAARMPPDSDSTYAVAFADVDLDGRPDVVFGNNGQNRLFLNDGTGVFVDATAARMPVDHDVAWALSVADVDSDGDPDLVCANGTPTERQQNRLYLNLRWQLDSPFRTKLRQPYQLDAYARYGPTGTVDTAVPFISTGTASIPVPPLGTFALDPAQMIRLPALIIPQPEGLGSTSFVVPNLPALIGVPVYAQAVVVQYPVVHRLTNWTADVIMQ